MLSSEITKLLPVICSLEVCISVEERPCDLIFVLTSSVALAKIAGFRCSPSGHNFLSSFSSSCCALSTDFYSFCRQVELSSVAVASLGEGTFPD